MAVSQGGTGCWPPVASQSELNTLTSKAGVLRNWTPITGNGPPAFRTICVACACVRPKWAIHSPAPALIPPAISALTTSVTRDWLM
jgi:hypothetical protein